MIMKGDGTIAKSVVLFHRWIRLVELMNKLVNVDLWFSCPFMGIECRREENM